MEISPMSWSFSNISNGEEDYFSTQIIPSSLGGMQQFTNFFLSIVTRGHDVLPESISQNFSSFNFLLNSGNSTSHFNDTISCIQTHWSDILFHNGLFLGMFAFGLIVALILPITGVIACIKQYCCPCIKKKNKPPHKNAKDIFRLQGLTTLFLLAMGWIGVAWLNGSNLAVQNGINELPENTKGYALKIY